MLVSPIEVSSLWSSRSQIQMRYYRKVAEMGRVLGPMSATHEAAAGGGVDVEAAEVACARSSQCVQNSCMCMCCCAKPGVIQRNLREWGWAREGTV